MDLVLHKTFFDAVGKGSVEELDKFASTYGMELVVQLVSSSNETGDTPLLLAVRENHEKMVDLLAVKFRAPISQSKTFMWQGLCYEEIPPFAVALISSNKTIPSIVSFLIVKDPFYTSPPFLHSIMSSNNTLQQKIDILELVGAAYILESLADGKKTNLPEFGLECLKQAILLRHGEPSVPKAGVNDIQQFLKNTSEVSTVEELEGLYPNSEWLQIQALLILYRILHRTQPIPSLYFLHFFSQFMVSRPHVKTVDPTEQICDVNAMLFILESYNVHEWETRGSFQFVSAAFLRLSTFFETLPKNLIPLESLLKFLWFLSVCSLVRKPFVTYLISRYPMLNILIQMICDQQPISPETKRCLTHYIPLINKEPYIIGRIYGGFYGKDKLIDMIELLVKAGASPNATVVYEYFPNFFRDDGNTPLHFLLKSCDVSPLMIARMKLLVEAGAHLDQVNLIGQSPVSLFKDMEKKHARLRLPAIPELQCLFYSVLPLKCYAAQAVAKHLVEYPQALPSELPLSIRSFIQLH